MNSTIKQVSRPAKTSGPKGLPPEAKKFAKQMGLDLTGLEAEAEDMWSMLNKMSMENPVQYEAFVAEQLKKGKAAEEGDGKSGGGRMIRPQTGFCIKVITTGNDGLKVRDFNKRIGKDFYVNFCSHEALEPPRDRNGQPALDDRVSAEGMEIPLMIGTNRDIDENEIAIDVIMHPVLVRRCEAHSFFKSQVIDLALEWVAKECPVQFNPLYNPVDCSYIGGRGEDKSTPVLFPVDEIFARQNAGGGAVTAAAITTSSTDLDTSSLLESFKQKQQQYQEHEEDTKLLVGSNIPFAGPSQKKKNIIQEVDSDGNVLPSSVEDAPRPATAVESNPGTENVKPAIKRGFLNEAAKKNKQLYPDEGSSEGAGGSTGGTYAKFMGKCQVVDTANMAPGADPPPLPPKQPVPQKQPRKAPALSATENQEIDDLLAAIDDDWGAADRREKQMMAEDNDKVAAQLQQLAAVLGGGSSGTDASTMDLANMMKNITQQPAPTHSTSSGVGVDVDPYALRNTLPPELPVSITVNSYLEGSRSITICVTGVDGPQLKATDLQVSGREALITIPDQGAVKGGCARVGLKFSCDTANVKASMSRKRRTIEVSISEKQ